MLVFLDLNCVVIRLFHSQISFLLLEIPLQEISLLEIALLDIALMAILPIPCPMLKIQQLQLPLQDLVPFC